MEASGRGRRWRGGDGGRAARARPGDGASGAGRGRRGVGHIEAKNRAVDGLLEALNKDEKSVLSVLGRANVAALVQLLTAPATKVREKAATVICQFAESGGCEGLLVSEGALLGCAGSRPPLPHASQAELALKAEGLYHHCH
uniref:Uncharacterized protein n=1 Tax=Oryza glumipatula TaxID=40148 RepID=A0A0E0ADB3_9ORYZ